MIDNQVLKNKLEGVDGGDYGLYQSLKGEYDFLNQFKLIIHQIPKDPYAPPHIGIYLIQVKRNDEKIINFDISSKIQEIAFRDYLARKFHSACKEVSKGKRGTGFSGIITISEPGQEMLDRNCVVIDDEKIEVRCFIGLPALGRKIVVKIAEEMLFKELPQIVELALFRENINMEQLNQHIKTCEDAQYLRNKLDSLGLVAFIADGSILPRQSATSDQPLTGESVIPFISPENLRINVQLPHGGLICGMGISKGVTLIVGGGYHGKSTLLNALERGCYNHIPGDGREYCVCLASCVKVRAYSGRSVVKTDISLFINNLPFKKNTAEFSTQNASGSTSQAASIIEAMEIGASVLLMDEDTCAANFMIRDLKMQKLVKKEDEPITSYIDKVKQLYSEKAVSTILVLGGVGDYFDVSDQIIQMIKYKPVDVTLKARQICGKFTEKRMGEDPVSSFKIKGRIPLGESVNSLSEYARKRIYAKEVHRLNFGETIIDLTDLEQLVELSQTKALGYALDYAKKYMDKKLTLKKVVDLVIHDIDIHGLDILSDRISGDLARFRSFELAFTLNRLRGFKVFLKK
ncbi:MAG: ABC-ATPase domain-containing protein [Desulfobacteraceae bacterium]|nr:ABC-ATPase domain-containing protein [Desulfobacteraceae bacterium]